MRATNVSVTRDGAAYVLTFENGRYSTAARLPRELAEETIRVLQDALRGGDGSAITAAAGSGRLG